MSASYSHSIVNEPLKTVAATMETSILCMFIFVGPLRWLSEPIILCECDGRSNGVSTSIAFPAVKIYSHAAFPRRHFASCQRPAFRDDRILDTHQTPDERSPAVLYPQTPTASQNRDSIVRQADREAFIPDGDARNEPSPRWHPCQPTAAT